MADTILKERVTDGNVEMLIERDRKQVWLNVNRIDVEVVREYRKRKMEEQMERLVGDTKHPITIALNDNADSLVSDESLLSNLFEKSNVVDRQEMVNVAEAEKELAVEKLEMKNKTVDAKESQQQCQADAAEADDAAEDMAVDAIVDADRTITVSKNVITEKNKSIKNDSIPREFKTLVNQSMTNVMNNDDEYEKFIAYTRRDAAKKAEERSRKYVEQQLRRKRLEKRRKVWIELKRENLIVNLITSEEAELEKEKRGIDYMFQQKVAENIKETEVTDAIDEIESESSKAESESEDIVESNESVKSIEDAESVESGSESSLDIIISSDSTKNDSEEGKHVKECVYCGYAAYPEKSKTGKKLLEIGERKIGIGKLLKCAKCTFAFHKNCCSKYQIHSLCNECATEKNRKNFTFRCIYCKLSIATDGFYECVECNLYGHSTKIDKVVNYCTNAEAEITLTLENANEFEFDVKWAEKSYRDICRLSGRWMKQCHIKKLSHYIQSQPKCYADTADSFDSNYCKIDKILTDNHTKLLVKWKNLDYDYCTFEKYTNEYDTHIARYKQRSKLVDLTKITKFNFKPFKTQPSYIVGGKLIDYQLDGVNWLLYNYSKNANCILADEMGLGKTVQCISFVTILCQVCSIAPALIIVPNSTIGHWLNEWSKWSNLRVVGYYGSSKQRSLISKYEIDSLKYEVIVTTFQHVASIPKQTYQLLIVDEGHRLKNDATRTFDLISRLKVKHKILMTGTPLQNNLDELLVLMNFIEIQHSIPSNSTLDPELLATLHTLLKPHFLRRTKSILNLPPITQVLVPVSLSPLQKHLYKSLLSTNSKLFLQKVVSSSNASLSSLLMDLRKCSNHPYLFGPSVEPEHEPTLDEYVNASGKLTLLHALLSRLQSAGHKVLLFSQFKLVLNVLEDYLLMAGYTYLRLDGDTPSTKRHSLISTFNNSSNVFCMLLTTRSGGEGISLTAADTVIIYDVDFNPQADLQAMARCHRIGQSRPVLVLKLFAKNTCEERIVQIGKQKLVLDHLVVEKMGAVDDTDVGSVLKYGAKLLFEESEEEANKEIRYTDEEVERLLERNERAEEKQSKGLDGFGFAQVWTLDKKSEETENGNGEMEKVEGGEDDEKFWEKWLEEKHLLEEQEYGRGKRKKVVRYDGSPLKEVLGIEDDGDEEFVAGSSDESEESQVEIVDLVGGVAVEGIDVIGDGMGQQNEVNVVVQEQKKQQKNIVKANTQKGIGKVESVEDRQVVGSNDMMAFGKIPPGKLIRDFVITPSSSDFANSCFICNRNHRYEECSCRFYASMLMFKRQEILWDETLVKRREKLEVLAQMLLDLGVSVDGRKRRVISRVRKVKIGEKEKKKEEAKGFPIVTPTMPSVPTEPIISHPTMQKEKEGMKVNVKANNSQSNVAVSAGNNDVFDLTESPRKRHSINATIRVPVKVGNPTGSKVLVQSSQLSIPAPCLPKLINVSSAVRTDNPRENMVKASRQPVNFNAAESNWQTVSRNNSANVSNFSTQAISFRKKSQKENQAKSQQPLQERTMSAPNPSPLVEATHSSLRQTVQSTKSSSSLTTEPRVAAPTISNPVYNPTEMPVFASYPPPVPYSADHMNAMYPPQPYGYGPPPVYPYGYPPMQTMQSSQNMISGNPQNMIPGSTQNMISGNPQNMMPGSTQNMMPGTEMPPMPVYPYPYPYPYYPQPQPNKLPPERRIIRCPICFQFDHYLYNCPEGDDPQKVQAGIMAVGQDQLIADRVKKGLLNEMNVLVERNGWNWLMGLVRGYLNGMD